MPGLGVHAPRGAVRGRPRVGVLALQGDVLEHLRALDGVGAAPVPVKRAGELDGLDGLLLPGGESTTIGRLLVLYGLMEPLRARIREGLPTFGTCAGAILLSGAARMPDGRMSTQPLLGCVDATARRNAFGAQVESFETNVEVRGVDGGPLHAVFIRAPWLEDVGPDVDVLATVVPGAPAAADAKVVVARQDHVLAAAFHPELTGDRRLHAYFLQMIRAH